MALSQLSKNIRRLHALHAQQKETAKEIDALKTYFRAEAGDVDTVFQYRELEVPVTWKERMSWDGDKLQVALGEKAGEFKKTSRYAEVGCRTAKAEVAA